MNLCMIDPLGKPIIYPCCDSEFCRCVRLVPQFRTECLRNASHSALESARERKPYYYKCFLGLMDFAVPVFYRDEYIGAICGGQIKTDDDALKPDFIYESKSLDEYPELIKLKDEIPLTDATRFLELSKLLLRLTEYLTHFGILLDFEKSSFSEQPDKAKLQPALIYIERNYDKKISLKALAALCFTSENYFSRLFTKIMGKTVSDYIQDVRIEKAKSLLENGELKIQAVAYEIGFNDAAYFIRKFKQSTGLTPGEYQSMHRK